MKSKGIKTATLNYTASITAMPKRIVSLAAMVVLVALSVAPTQAFAHLDGGEDKQQGDVVIDFGYLPGTPVAQQPATLALHLVFAEVEVPLEETEWAWVRMSQGDTVYFSELLHLSDGNITWITTFPKPGSYTVDVSFEQGERTITETFDIDVESAGWARIQRALFGIAASVVY